MPSRAQSGAPIHDQAITQTYPVLYKAVFRRDADQLLTFTNDSSMAVRRQAWRALAQTPVDSISTFIDQVKNDGSAAAWFALSLHDMSAEELRRLETYWTNYPEDRASVALVLGRQGDDQSLHLFLRHLDEINGSSYDQASALAVGRLMVKFSLNKTQQFQIIKTAFSANDPKIARTWLYGFYRGAKTKLHADLKDSLRTKWKSYGAGKDAGVDQYVARILGSAVFTDLVDTYASLGELKNETPLSVELAKLVKSLQMSEQNRREVKKLLEHPNPHVQQLTWANLAGKLSPDDRLYPFVTNQLLADQNISPVVWLQALQTIAATDSTVIADHARRMNRITENNPYLFPQVLELWMREETSEAFIKRIRGIIKQGDPLKSMYAVNALNEFWHSKDLGQKSQFKRRTRKITWDALALHDRGVSYAVEPLLEDSSLFKKDDFKKINTSLREFELPSDIEVYQTFGRLYKKRFEQQAKPFIDSLAALNYAPLNRSLKQAGWKVSVPQKATPHFRAPNWQRLWQLDRHPIWVLETAKGTIKVKMNTLSAPATVSAIDSLSRVGAYNGVPFHRVVPNFVIQGGDIERQDGFGGPDFVIPTEASEHGFVRGAAGVASAGPDTEGSQYFFMLQDAPHLNGHYTLFGRVVEGMNVVKKIVVGDKVKKAHWEF